MYRVMADDFTQILCQTLPSFYGDKHLYQNLFISVEPIMTYRSDKVLE